MQLNFLQEDLLEHMQDDKPAALAATAQKKPAKPATPSQSLLMDLPPVAKPAAKKPAASAPLISAEEKSPAAFKTISEAAELLGVPAYVLRFWESQFPQISPTKSRGGRRYYRPEDMEILATIQSLLYKQGYTIKGARKAFAQTKYDLAHAEKPVPVQLQAPDKPLITPRQRSELSTIRGELLSLREQLMPYLA